MEPSFFVVGAPKCGTTALCKYLDRHPSIFIPRAKELHYFDTDLDLKRQAKSPEDYLAFFAENRHQKCGEGTPSYLYSQTAAATIRNFNSRAKIVIMLRNPVDVMYALHSQALFNGSSEVVADFSQALKLEPLRQQGQKIPEQCREPKTLLYRDRVRFPEQIQRYFDNFDRDSVHFIIFEDFTKKTAEIYQNLLEFLEVDSGFTTDFKPVNANKKVRNRKLQSLLKYPPKPILSLGKYMLPLPQRYRRALLERIKQRLRRANTQKLKRPPLDQSLRRQLTTELMPEVKRLEHLIQRDLSAWYS